MTKMSIVMILIIVLALISAMALAGNPDPAAARTGLKEMSASRARLEKKINDCRAGSQKVLISTQEPIPGLSPLPGASGCLLSDGPKTEAEPGQLFQIDPQLDQVQMHGN
jgi:hypothetical protein